MAITLALADSYFEERNHPESAIWNAFDPAHQEGAIAQAIRVLKRVRMVPYYTYSGTDPSDQTNLLDTDATTDAQFPREDLATYEQALHILKFSDAVPDGTKTGPKWIAANIRPLREAGVDPNSIAPEAARWMGWNYRAPMVVRG